MCEYCGCRSVPLIGELMDEHTALLDQAAHIRHALAEQRWDLAADLITVFTHVLRVHVAREERGVFRAMRDQGEYAEEVAALESEHLDLEASLARLDQSAPEGLVARFEALVGELSEHVEREDLGIFPVAVVSLGATGWQTVADAHRDVPPVLPPRPDGLTAPGDRPVRVR